MQKIHPPRLPKPMPANEPEAFDDHVHIYQSSINGLDYSNLHAGGLILEQVKARKLQMMRSNLPGLRVVDSILDLCEFSGAEWEKSFFRRVVFQGCRLLGAQMLEAIFEDVEFIHCQAEGLSLVSTKFKNCRFSKCMLRKASFDGADVRGMIFSDCDLLEANFHLAKMQGTDLRTAQIGGLKIGVEEMQGAIIAPHQTLQVVGLLGVKVQEIDQLEEE
jgi:uncharacterized protein YjbI with pentapeptide repeats